MNVKFDSKEEVEELNSVCNFCNRVKFYAEYVDGQYQLIRCSDETCEEHCKFGHKVDLSQTSIIDHSDVMSIVRGSDN